MTWLAKLREAAETPTLTPYWATTFGLVCEVLEAAKANLQDHLDDHAHGNVDDWSQELEREIGWGADCNAYRAARAFAALRAHLGEVEATHV